jgi:hypothetical protein
MVTRLRHVNPIQFALIVGLLYAIIGLIVAVCWLPFAAVVGSIGSSAHYVGAGLGILALIVFPVGYFIATFIFGLITAALYNLIASWTGGFEVTLEQVAPAVGPAGSYTAG